MRKNWLNAALYHANNLPKVKEIVKSVEGSDILVVEAKVNLQTADLATQLFKFKDQYECLVRLVETMESAKCTIKEVVQAIYKLDFGEDTCSISYDIQQRVQNNDISKILNV